MKLRQKLEDFKVEEINKFNTSKEKKKFKLYLFEKRGLESFSVLRYLAKQNRISMPMIGIAGLKDRHAITRQYLTIPSQYVIKTLKEKNFDIKFLGYIDRGIKLGDLEGNRFVICVRDIKKSDLQGIYKKAGDLGQYGAPNYFDSQRFGSVIAGKFIAKFVILKDYEQAVKMYLTRYTKHENKELKKERRLIYKNWDKITNIKIKNSTLAVIINKYKEGGSWLEAYKKIPSYLRELYRAAYQSYLWNECVKEILRENLDKKYLFSVEYNIGSLLFYKKLEKEIPKEFPIISYNSKLPSFEKGVYDRILGRENILLKDFDIYKEAGEHFITGTRKIIIKPIDFKISEPSIDEINDKGKKNKFKINLSFSLSKGSYATIITKRLFGK